MNDQGKEALNFQICYTIYLIIAGILCFVLIGIPIFFGLYLADIILTVIAGIKANEGVNYRYPGIMRLVS